MFKPRISKMSEEKFIAFVKKALSRICKHGGSSDQIGTAVAEEMTRLLEVLNADHADATLRNTVEAVSRLSRPLTSEEIQRFLSPDVCTYADWIHQVNCIHNERNSKARDNDVARWQAQGRDIWVDEQGSYVECKNGVTRVIYPYC